MLASQCATPLISLSPVDGACGITLPIFAILNEAWPSPAQYEADYNIGDHQNEVAFATSNTNPQGWYLNVEPEAFDFGQVYVGQTGYFPFYFAISDVFDPDRATRFPLLGDDAGDTYVLVNGSGAQTCTVGGQCTNVAQGTWSEYRKTRYDGKHVFARADGNGNIEDAFVFDVKTGITLHLADNYAAALAWMDNGGVTHNGSPAPNPGSLRLDGVWRSNNLGINGLQSDPTGIYPVIPPGQPGSQWCGININRDSTYGLISSIDSGNGYTLNFSYSPYQTVTVVNGAHSAQVQFPVSLQSITYSNNSHATYSFSYTAPFTAHYPPPQGYNYPTEVTAQYLSGVTRPSESGAGNVFDTITYAMQGADLGFDYFGCTPLTNCVPSINNGEPEILVKSISYGSEMHLVTYRNTNPPNDFRITQVTDQLQDTAGNPVKTDTYPITVPGCTGEITVGLPGSVSGTSMQQVYWWGYPPANGYIPYGNGWGGPQYIEDESGLVTYFNYTQQTNAYGALSTVTNSSLPPDQANGYGYTYDSSGRLATVTRYPDQTSVLAIAYSTAAPNPYPIGDLMTGPTLGVDRPALITVNGIGHGAVYFTSGSLPNGAIWDLRPTTDYRLYGTSTVVGDVLQYAYSTVTGQPYTPTGYLVSVSRNGSNESFQLFTPTWNVAGDGPLDGSGNLHYLDEMDWSGSFNQPANIYRRNNAPGGFDQVHLGYDATGFANAVTAYTGGTSVYTATRTSNNLWLPTNDTNSFGTQTASYAPAGPPLTVTDQGTTGTTVSDTLSYAGGDLTGDNNSFENDQTSLYAEGSSAACH